MHEPFFFNPVRGEAVSGQQRALRAAPRRLPQGYVLVLRVFCGGARVARRALMYVQSCGFAAKCLARHKGHIYIGYIGAPHRGPQDSVYTKIRRRWWSTLHAKLVRRNRFECIDEH